MVKGSQDERHANVKVVHRGAHSRRAYGDWTMALERPENAAFARVMGFLDELEIVEDRGPPPLQIRAML